MAATRQDIINWFDLGVEGGWEQRPCTHMIVVCDEFDWDDYPVFVYATDNAREIYQQYSDKEMQRVMECYSLRLPLEVQLAEQRAMHFD